MEQNLFGQILINFNLITQEQLDKVVELQKKSNPPRFLGELLVEQGFIDDKSLKSILSVQKRKLDLTKAQPKGAESELQRRLQGAPATEFLRVSKELGASDIYITSGLKPMIRLHGNLLDLPADPPGFGGLFRGEAAQAEGQISFRLGGSQVGEDRRLFHDHRQARNAGAPPSLAGAGADQEAQPDLER